MAQELMQVAIRCSEDPAVRTVTITGSGRFFCAGGDLKSFAAQGESIPAHVKEVTSYLHAGISRLTRMNAPVIASVNGVAAGAGMSIACACDFVIAAESARFTMAYTGAGLTPDGSSTYFLPRIVGLKRAIDLALTNRMLSAAEAAEWGLVTRVVPDADLATETSAMASELASGPTVSFGRTKRLFHSGFSETLETQMEHEAQAIAKAAQSDDGREGIAAFLEKRATEFKGR
jgi:2-(1,2-epoxy-1,2-dihydrophenyl)acetyl-CoA isomerase